ncbi:MAG: hypothetical protein PHC75_02045 [Burkholderiales bacterium]|nr:hypothetical protein [Burkholderiales bacterium]
MIKQFSSTKKNIGEKLKEIVKKDPSQIEDEIFSDIDKDGFNQNASEQQNYPGIQKHKQPKDKKA